LVEREDDDGYIAVVPDLPGCSAFGETSEEALKEIRTALSSWIETARGNWERNTAWNSQVMCDLKNDADYTG
jgi:predicted RNase H-like HicB family nuclease